MMISPEITQIFQNTNVNPLGCYWPAFLAFYVDFVSRCSWIFLTFLKSCLTPWDAPLHQHSTHYLKIHCIMAVHAFVGIQPDNCHAEHWSFIQQAEYNIHHTIANYPSYSSPSLLHYHSLSEIRTWISDHTPQSNVIVITYPCPISNTSLANRS